MCKTRRISSSISKASVLKCSTRWRMEPTVRIRMPIASRKWATVPRKILWSHLRNGHVCTMINVQIRVSKLRSRETSWNTMSSPAWWDAYGPHSSSSSATWGHRWQRRRAISLFGYQWSIPKSSRTWVTKSLSNNLIICKVSKLGRPCSAEPMVSEYSKKMHYPSWSQVGISICRIWATRACKK